MRQWIVTGTSIAVEAETSEEAIDRAQETSGWHWEAEEWTDPMAVTRTTTCTRCGCNLRFDVAQQMWLRPDMKGTSGRWCQTSAEFPVQVHSPDFDAVVEG